MSRPNLVSQLEREMRRPTKTPGQIWRGRITVMLFLLAAPLLLAEAALRLAGYSRPQIDPAAQLTTMQQAVDVLNQRYETRAFEVDPYLLWKFRPEANFYGHPVDGDGTLAYPVSENEAPRGIKPLRVLVLGDHVTATGLWTYPHMAQRLAQAAPHTGLFLQVENAAVPGYSSEQLLRLWARGSLPESDIVLVSTGWADQSPALNLPDRNLGFSGRGGSILHRLMSPIRLYQLMGAPLGARSIHQQLEPEMAAKDLGVRVPPAAYRQNLTNLLDAIRKAGKKPLLSTQPWSDPLEGATTGTERGVYTDIVRQVASATRTPLMDLEAEFLRRRRDELLQPDGIHLTPKGHNHVARLLLALLRDEGHIASADYDSIAEAERHDTASPDKPRVVWTLSQDQVETSAGQTIPVSILAQNAGNTRWLRKHTVPQFNEETKMSHGTTHIAGRWVTEGIFTTAPVVQVPLPSDILPGEATSVTLPVVAPDEPGQYQMEIGLRTDGAGELKHYGAETTTLTLVAW